MKLPTPCHFDISFHDVKEKLKGEQKTTLKAKHDSGSLPQKEVVMLIQNDYTKKETIISIPDSTMHIDHIHESFGIWIENAF